jgi:hypothetical protein
MTDQDMIVIASVVFIIFCWAWDHPASFKWVGLVLGVVVVGTIAVHSGGSRAARHTRTNERSHYRKGYGQRHHRYRRRPGQRHQGQR